MAYDVSHRGASFQNTFTRKTRELAALGFSLFWVPVRYMLALGLHANARRWKGDTPRPFAYQRHSIHTLVHTCVLMPLGGFANTPA